MPSLDEIEDSAATHMLLCADTKMGKSDYVAHAILAGFHCLYINADNGVNTLKKVLKDDPAAKKRVKVLNTQKPYDFMVKFTESKGVFRWNITQDREFQKSMSKDTDIIAEIRPNRIPVGMLFSLDSWTTTAFNAMQVSAEDNDLTVTTMGKTGGQSVYGDSNIRLTQMLGILQHVKFHTIVQAHSEFYEVLEKPAGKNVVKQSEMIIKETIQIPKSSSRSHGAGMGKYFNEIGWLRVNRTEQQVLDFKKIQGRIGGGTPDGEGDPRKGYSFVNLFAKPVPFTDEEVELFYKEFPASEYVPANPVATKPAAAVKPAEATATLPPAGTPATTSGLAALMARKTS